MKFKYDYLTNRLWKINSNSPEYLCEILEENKFNANFGSQGFLLGDNSWITFTLYSQRIKVFAKICQKGEIIYYRQEIPITPRQQLPLIIPNSYREIIFEFTEENRVVKNNQGYWVPQRESG